MNSYTDLNRIDERFASTPLHWLLDHEYSRAGALWYLEHGADPNIRVGPRDETALHVTVRRRRLDMVDPLLGAGAEIDVATAGGKTAWVHAYRRGFTEVTEALAERGAECAPNAADELAAAVMRDDLDGAAAMLRDDPSLAKTDNPEEARVLPDIAGYDRVAGVKLLLDHGAPIDARGLEDATALHTAAWFGAPRAARLLIDRGAPLEIRGDLHDLSPLGWVCHGSRYSAAAADRAGVYDEIAEMLLVAGASFVHEHDPEERPGKRMFEDATDSVRKILRSHGLV